MFADDCLIFAEATNTAARFIAKVLKDFSCAFRQEINFHKSSLYFSNNARNQFKNDIVNILQIQHKTTIGKYLGIHNIIFWKDPVNTKELIIKIQNKLSTGRSILSLRQGDSLLSNIILLESLIILFPILNVLIRLRRLLIEKVGSFCGEKTLSSIRLRGTKYVVQKRMEVLVFEKVLILITLVWLN